MIELTKASIKFKLLNFLVRYHSMEIGDVFVGKGSRLRSAYLNIKSGTRINGAITVKGSGEVRIGHYCAIGDDVIIISSNHAVNSASIQLSLQKKLCGLTHIEDKKINVVIGHDVWIGDRVTLLPGVTIGNGAVIGAGSVVTRNINPYSIVAGVPAKGIGERFPKEIVYGLEGLRWWDKTSQQLEDLSFLFSHEFNQDIERDKAIITKAARETNVN